MDCFAPLAMTEAYNGTSLSCRFRQYSRSNAIVEPMK
jgi:hypothetical protein